MKLTKLLPLTALMAASCHQQPVEPKPETLQSLRFQELNAKNPEYTVALFNFTAQGNITGAFYIGCGDIRSMSQIGFAKVVAEKTGVQIPASNYELASGTSEKGQKFLDIVKPAYVESDKACEEMALSIH